MNIFLDTISKENVIILFDDKKEILDEFFFDIKSNESTLLIPKIDEFIKKNNLTYFDIKNIVLVVGPGSFTGIRTTILTINTINFVIKKNLTGITYFDLFSDFPIIKSSSKKDCFLKLKKDSQIEIIENIKVEELIKKNNIKKVFGDIDFLSNLDLDIITKPDYKKIIKNLKFDNKVILTPFYIKKPSIS